MTQSFGNRESSNDAIVEWLSKKFKDNDRVAVSTKEGKMLV